MAARTLQNAQTRGSSLLLERKAGWFGGGSAGSSSTSLLLLLLLLLLELEPELLDLALAAAADSVRLRGAEEEK